MGLIRDDTKLVSLRKAQLSTSSGVTLFEGPLDITEKVDASGLGSERESE